MSKRVSLIGVTLAVAFAIASASPAAEKCQVKILKTGEIQVAAKSVATNPRWGTTLANIGATFSNEGACYDAAGLKLKKCNLGNPATLAGIMPPFNCQVCVDDDGPDSCCAFAKGCAPGMRVRDASFPPGDPRIEAVEVSDSSTLGFTGVNLQIVSGSGNTWGALNSTGNLIVGYNEQDVPPAPRTGSHNVVVGEQHGWTAYSGIVLGNRNRILGGYAAVSGGSGNVAASSGAAISGGYNNNIDLSGSASTISGGQNNTIASNSSYSSISGGRDNTVSGSFLNASISGGWSNTVSEGSSTITGGAFNTVLGYTGSISGGGSNYIGSSATYSTIAAGYSNGIYGTAANSAISGGQNNGASGTSSTVGGGTSVGAITTNAFHAGRTSGFPTATVY